jgi:hypothetical protein
MTRARYHSAALSMSLRVVIRQRRGETAAMAPVGLGFADPTYEAGKKWDRSLSQRGQHQLSGRSSKAVSGGT